MDPDQQNRGICDGIRKFIRLEGENILEVGCGNGGLLKMIARDYAPKHIVGVDRDLANWWGISESEGENWAVQNGDAENLPFTDNSFDSVISINTFEHIGEVGKALSEIRRVLKPFGRFYSIFAPLWTSVFGHHFGRQTSPGDEYWKAEILRLIPPWGHLYLDEDGMRAHLTSQTPDRELIRQMLDFTYRSPIINRRSRGEILKHLLASGLLIRHFREFPAFSRFHVLKDYPDKSSELTPEIIVKVKAGGYDPADLGVLGMIFCLEKYRDG